MCGFNIDYQLVRVRCECCGVTFEMSRGNVYQASRRVGLYLAAMHGCKTRQVLLAVALMRDADTPTDHICITLRAWTIEAEFQMKVTNPDESPWRDVMYLQPVLSRGVALKDSLLPAVFEISDQIVMRPPVRDYLEGS